MTHDKWFISDTHFFHTNILRFTGKDGKRIRPFDSLEDMHEYMIEKWNSVVKDNDYVYHLGDVTFQYHGAFNNLMHRLKGKKRLIVGNHDKIWNPALIQNFEKADLWKGFKEHNFTASHMPLPLESLRDGAFCVHGHVHQNTLDKPGYINVSVEVRDYTPVHTDELAKEMK
jgi:calcineurin-like phosphoesterase family protein